MTPAKTAITQLGKHTVITVKEPITYQNCKELEDCIQGAAGKSQTAIILECKAVGYIDSGALEMLLRLQEKVRERGNATEDCRPERGMPGYHDCYPAD